MGEAAPGAPGPARGRRPDRLGARVPRQRQCPGKKGGQQTGPDPTNRGKPGTKRHLVVDRRGTPLAALLTGANRHDSVPLRSPPRRDPADHAALRPAAHAPGEAARRQGLRLPALPPGVDAAGHQGPDRAQRRRLQRPARPPPLGGGADVRLAGPVPPPHHPLRTPPRHPRRLPLPRLLAHLPQRDHTVLLGALSALQNLARFVRRQWPLTCFYLASGLPAPRPSEACRLRESSATRANIGLAFQYLPDRPSRTCDGTQGAAVDCAIPVSSGVHLERRDRADRRCHHYHLGRNHRRCRRCLGGREVAVQSVRSTDSG